MLFIVILDPMNGFVTFHSHLVSVCICVRVLFNGISALLNYVSRIVSLSGRALFFNAYVHCTDNNYSLFYKALVSFFYYFVYFLQ